jgi:hypothetical protein
MKIKEIDENLNYAMASMIIWINCARAPLASCRALLDAAHSPEKKIYQAARIWLIATLMGFIIQLPIYGLLGIDWKRMEFYAPSILFLMLAFLMTVAVLQAGFKIYKVESSFAEVLVIYSVLIGTYSPILQVLALAGMYDILAAMKAVKTQGVGLGVIEVIGGVFENIRERQEDTSAIGIYKSVAGVLLLVISQFLIVFFVYGLSGFYAIERHRAVASVGFSLGFLLPVPLFLIGFLYYTALYAVL